MSYKDRAAAAGAAADSGATCRACGTAAPLDTLSSHGGMCFGCFSAYRRERQAMPARVPDSAIPVGAGGAAWAYRLRWRHQQGERLTATQVAMYRETIERRERVAEVQA